MRLIRYALLLFAFAFVSVHQPGAVEAQRYRAAVKKGPKARPGAAPRLKARAKAKTQPVRPRAQRPSGLARVGKGMRASVAMRGSIKSQRATTKEALKAGKLTAAATEVSRSPLRNAKGQFVKGPKNLSMRERFAMWRSTRAVKKAAMKQAKGRSEAGDVQGTVDALQALSVLEAKGKFGVIGRWRVARATKKAFSNSRKAASASLKAGDTETAGQNFALATEIGTSKRATKNMASTLVKESFQMASAYAKAGNPQLAWNVLEMASAMAERGGAKFSEKKAQKIVEKAFANALPVLTKTAEQAYKAGNLEQAVASLAEARAISGSGTAKPSRSVARRQARMAKKLGSRLQEFEVAQAAQQQQAAAPQ